MSKLNVIAAALNTAISNVLTEHKINFDGNDVKNGANTLAEFLLSETPIIAETKADTVSKKPEPKLVNVVAAADLLLIAFDHFQAGDKREALATALLAFEADDMVDFATAMTIMNQHALSAAIDAETDEIAIDEEEKDKPAKKQTDNEVIDSVIKAAEDEEEIEEPEDEEDDDSEDDYSEEDEKDTETNQDESAPVEDEEDEEDDTPSKDNMKTIKVPGMTEEAAVKRAVANRISLTGDSESRKQAEILKKTKTFKAA